MLQCSQRSGSNQRIDSFPEGRHRVPSLLLPSPTNRDMFYPRSIIPIHLQPDMVGPLAREHLQWRAQPGQLIQERRMRSAVCDVQSA